MWRGNGHATLQRTSAGRRNRGTLKKRQEPQQGEIPTSRQTRGRPGLSRRWQQIASLSFPSNQLSPASAGLFSGKQSVKKGGLRTETAQLFSRFSNQTSMTAMILWLRSTMMI
jgi:hypothetical protein